MNLENKLKRLTSKDLLDEVAVTQLAETVALPGKGVAKLVKMFEDIQPKTNYPAGDEGLKAWLLQNSSAVMINGTIDISKISLTYSDKKLSMFALKAKGRSTILMFPKGDEDTMPRADAYSINLTGYKTEDDFELMPVENLAKVCVVYNERGIELKRREITGDELESLKATGTLVISTPIDKIVGIYGVSNTEEPTIMARFWWSFSIGSGGISVEWGHGNGDTQYWSFP